MRISPALTKINLGRERWKQPSAVKLWPLTLTNKSRGLSLTVSLHRDSLLNILPVNVLFKGNKSALSQLQSYFCSSVHHFRG